MPSELLKRAIKDRLVIQFMYDGKKQIVEPYIIGYLNGSSQKILLGYGIMPELTDPWSYFILDNISELAVLDLKAYSYRAGIARHVNKIKPVRM
jgi:hypothetical protein